MKNKNYKTESSRNICNVCLSKVKVEFCNMQPDSSLEESEKAEEEASFYQIATSLFTVNLQWDHRKEVR